MKHNIIDYHIPENGTGACSCLLDELMRITKFYLYTLQAEQLFPFNLDTIFDNFKERQSTNPKIEQILTTLNKETYAKILALGTHEPLLGEWILCASVNSFHIYLCDLLELILKKQPNILKSGEQVKIEFILKHDSMEHFINSLAEEKVSTLAFKGIRELSDFYKKELGLDLFEDDEQTNQAVEIIEFRNIFVHSRGQISRIFKKRLPKHPAIVGDKIELDSWKAIKHCEFFANIAFKLDNQAANKFGLKVGPLKGKQNSFVNDSLNKDGESI